MNVVEKTWEEFRAAGLLWWLNRTLHLFGWAIVSEPSDDPSKPARVYPARVTFRGFQEDAEEQGFVNVTRHLQENIETLVKEVES